MMKWAPGAFPGTRSLGRITPLVVAMTLAMAVLFKVGPVSFSAVQPSSARSPYRSLSAPPASSGHFDLLLIGDSITGTRRKLGFRPELRDRLAAEPSHTFTLVGSRGKPPLRGHFGGGREVQEFYPTGFGNGWGTGTFDVTPDLGPPGTPDIVAIHLGTNDLDKNSPPFVPYSRDHGRTLIRSHAGELAELLQLLINWQNGSRSDKLQHIILSTIIPIQDRDDDVKDWNNAVIAITEDLAEGIFTGAPVRVTIADHYRRFLSNPSLFTFGPDDWMLDALHPSAAGEAQMADVYHRAILASIEDSVAPAAVRGLEVSVVDSTSMTLTFIAAGDDSASGQASRYDVRYATEPFDSHDFGLATQAVDESVPGPPAAPDTISVGGLLPSTTYYLAFKVVDNAGNRSPMSNLVRRTTFGTSWQNEAVAVRTEVGIADEPSRF